MDESEIKERITKIHLHFTQKSLEVPDYGPTQKILNSSELLLEYFDHKCNWNEVSEQLEKVKNEDVYGHEIWNLGYYLSRMRGDQ